MTLIDELAGVTLDIRKLRHETALDAHRVKVARNDVDYFEHVRQVRTAALQEQSARQGALVLRLLTDGRSHARALRVVRALKL